MSNPDVPAIPLYSLYGQIDSAAELRFLHVESLAARNQLHNWDIRPHRHHDLHQLVWVWQGGGEVELDEELLQLDAPVLISVPPSVVHGFRWRPQSQGMVLTIADSFKAELALMAGDPAIGAALQGAQVLAAFERAAHVEALSATFRTIADEFVYERTGRTTVISGHLLILFAQLARLRLQSQPGVLAVNARGGDAYKRFRELVEIHFRAHWPVSAYAAAMAVTERSLRRLTVKFSHQSPIQLVHRRLVLEAKRSLLYTELPIAEVGYGLGFDDPSYFTRFFIDHAGETPLQFRRSRGTAATPSQA